LEGFPDLLITLILSYGYSDTLECNRSAAFENIPLFIKYFKYSKNVGTISQTGFFYH